MAGKKAKALNYVIDQNPVEALRNVSEDLGVKKITSALASEGKQDIKSLWDMMLGVGDYKTSGELTEGHALDLRQKRQSPQQEKSMEKPKARIDAAYNYTSEIIHSEKRTSREQTQHMTMMIEQLRNEIKKLASETKELKTNVEFSRIIVEDIPEKPGKYHLNFFEWLLSVVRDARIKVEDSSSWLGSMVGKNSKKNYWGLYKKHGTSFGLSGERTVATQTG